MKRVQLAVLLVLAACGPETTLFRPTDASDPGRPAVAQYAVDAARVNVWSNGGYVGPTGEPMTHIGFEIRNTGSAPVVFDGDALQLIVFGARGQRLPLATFTTVTPLGPARVSVPAGTTTALEAFFLLPVRPRAIDTMQVRWSLKIGDAAFIRMSSFTRDDDYPVLDSPPAAPQLPAST